MTEIFDIMTTATLRPELLKRTFDSFREKLFGDAIKNARLIINVDMVGSKEPEKSLKEILNYLESIPFHDMEVSVSREPSFSQAFCRILSHLENPLVFNLEEDWELTRKTDFDEMLDLFKKDPDLVHLRLSFFRSTNNRTMKTWNKFIEWNGKYFEVPRNLRGTIGWAGHPSLNKTSFMLFFASILNPDSNPEKQIKGGYPIILNSRFGCYHPYKANPPALIDLGRDWKRENGYQKKGVKAFFTEWEKIDERK